MKVLQTICSKYILLSQRESISFEKSKKLIKSATYYWLEDSQNKNLTKRF